MSAAADAARYRHALRDAEAERDRQAARLEVLHRAEVAALTGSAGVRAEVLWRAGTTLVDLLDDNGNVDPHRVQAAADAAAAALGVTPRQPKPASVAGLESGSMRRPPPRDAFTDAFRGGG